MRKKEEKGSEQISQKTKEGKKQLTTRHRNDTASAIITNARVDRRRKKWAFGENRTRICQET